MMFGTYSLYVLGENLMHSYILSPVYCLLQIAFSLGIYSEGYCCTCFSVVTDLTMHTSGSVNISHLIFLYAVGGSFIFSPDSDLGV